MGSLGVNDPNIISDNPALRDYLPPEGTDLIVPFAEAKLSHQRHYRWRNHFDNHRTKAPRKRRVLATLSVTMQIEAHTDHACLFRDMLVNLAGSHSVQLN